MRDYVKQLIDNFDGNGDGYISFSELCDGLKRMNVHLTLREKQGIMKKLDINRDGEISGEELYGILSKVDTKLSRA
jgi:Ca2+-binding EF-hand superfamily protein